MIPLDAAYLNVEVLLWINLLSTWFMVGLIWFVQVVHYPLFALVGEHAFSRYANAHRRRTTWVVAPPMLIEVASACALVLTPDAVLNLAVNQVYLWSGVLMLAGVWLLTALVSVPCHHKLAHGFNPTVHRWLVLSNIGRTILWTGRGLLMLLCLRQYLAGVS